MPESPAPTQEFVNRAIAVIQQNLANEQFGVSELADAMNMSRSNLLRKVKKETNLSVSQLINQVRLQHAMELLRTSSLTISEISHQVGFNSLSYFIKCFREYYGYPPGEVNKHLNEEPKPIPPAASNNRNWWIASGVALVTALVALYIYVAAPFGPSTVLEKSIAVLPFKNESSDSANVYLINGLMESTLGSLQKIKDLRVISRTSSEKYRDTRKSIPEMAKELNVSYFVEGSGQKIGDKIVLNIQLIDAQSDRHLWSAQYNRETKDIFQLQQEIAKSIAEEIKAIITPEEENRIRKKPTDNLVAYDLFLKGKAAQAIPDSVNQQKAIQYFIEATQQDSQFAMAYAEIAITYYYMDIFHVGRKYSNSISMYADKAILYDAKMGESLVAKALSYISRREFELAEPYLEKALEYNPNSAQVIGFLTDFYAMYLLNTGKYLQYALQGVQLNIEALDSTTASYNYLRLSNALIQNGFVNESLKYVDKSLSYNSNNPFSRYVRAFILFAKTEDAAETRNLLLAEFNKDTTRFDILQDIGKISYFMRDYKGALHYYQRFLTIRERQQLDVYRHENLTIADVMEKAGEHTKAKELAENYKSFFEADRSVYRHLGLSAYYTYTKNQAKAIEHMQLFAKEENVQYWIILFLEKDPMMETIKDNPEFKKYFGEAKAKFWKSHNALRKSFNEKRLL
ncbi:MAG: helix-turn-helix domain-containing protein [Cyclobacteriaceae bacterium]|nr:helix-turn-helix domain-containing protein [Cyclobacteriaceae bacterium]